ncbi:MAG: AAA family ATPase [Anaerolineae bacterium]|jgi:predicted ATPase/DNA-binding SARP family transcriptional activator
MPALQLFLLGPLDMQYDGQQVPKPPTLKSQSLLAYLAVHRRHPQNREQLASLFWGDRPERKARRSLRTALWHIRRCLPDKNLILSDSTMVQMDPDSDLWLDVEGFETQASCSKAPNLESVLTLYRGDFLDGFFDDWIISERYRLELLFLDTLARLMWWQETVGEHHAALATALNLLERDPLREDAHRLTMRVYCHLGQRNAALEQYHRCREIVFEELGAEPMAETTELYQAILDGRFEVGPPPASAPVLVQAKVAEGRNPLDLTTPTRLVGRELELSLLHRCWQGARDGEGGLMLISGEAGVGKTRLLEEFANRLRWQGARVLWGRCYEFERVLPYQPVAEALRTLVPLLTPDELAGFPTWTLGQVARLVPEMSEKCPELEIPPAESLERERARLFEGVTRFTADLARHGPLLVVLEDLHWASESTLQMLHYLTRHLAAHSVLIVGTFRPGALTPQHHLTTLQHELLRDGVVTPLSLKDLSAEVVETLVLEMSGAGSAVMPLASRLYEETEGNPFYLMETVKALFEKGTIQLREGAWHGDFARISRGEIPLPTGVAEAIQARARRLGDDAQEVLRLAAVLGREFEFDLLNVTWDRSEEMTLEALDDLLRARLIEEGSGPLERDYAFTHHKIQEAVYSGTPLRRRQHLHTRIGHAMEKIYAPDLEGMAGELAFHFDQARQADKTLTEKAIHYLRLAGEHAKRVSANEEAIVHLDKAVMLLQSLPDTSERASQELELQIRRGPSLMAMKGYGAVEVKKTYDRALELYQDLDDPPQQIAVLRGLWGFYLMRAEYRKAQDLAERLLTLAQRPQHSALLMDAHGVAGMTLFYLGELSAAHEYLERAISLYNPQEHHSLTFVYGQDPGVCGLNHCAWALWFRGYPEQALQRSQESVTLAQELSHPFSLAFALAFSARVHIYRREARAAQEVSEATIALCTEQGFPFWLAMASILRGWARAEQGQEQAGIGEMRKGLGVWRATGAALAETSYLALMAEVYGQAGQAEEGLRLLAEAFAAVKQREECYFEAELHRLQGELLLARPAAEAEAEACFLRAAEIARQQHAKSWELRAATSLARLWQSQGRSEEARQVLDPVYAWFTEGFDTLDLIGARSLLESL